MFNSTTQLIVHPSDQNFVSLFGQMDVIVPIHVAISMGRW